MTNFIDKSTLLVLAQALPTSLDIKVAQQTCIIKSVLESAPSGSAPPESTLLDIAPCDNISEESYLKPITIHIA